MAKKSKLDFSNAVDNVNIPGLEVVTDFITSTEETELLTELDKGKWIKLANRRV